MLVTRIAEPTKVLQVPLPDTEHIVSTDCLQHTEHLISSVLTYFRCFLCQPTKPCSASYSSHSLAGSHCLCQLATLRPCRKIALTRHSPPPLSYTTSPNQPCRPFFVQVPTTRRDLAVLNSDLLTLQVCPGLKRTPLYFVNSSTQCVKPNPPAS